MNYFKIFFQSFVKPFYKENTGAFVFVFTMMFFIVSTVDGAGLYAYHYSLVTAILTSKIILLLVLFAWFLYVRKYAGFISDIMAQPKYVFLQVYNELSSVKRFCLFLLTEFLLLMPVLLYLFFIAFVGFKEQLYLKVWLIVSYLLVMCIATALCHVHQLNSLNKPLVFPWQKWSSMIIFPSSYKAILLRFVIKKQSTLWVGIKLFTCGFLYLIGRNNTAGSYDISMVFLFYNFGILSNGILVFRIRAFEETYLSFYRSLPVSLVKRLLQYAFVYVFLLVPEIVTTLTLAPVQFYWKDAMSFILCGFSLLLLMNSITFLYDFKMKEYLKILLVVFFIACIFLVTAGLFFLSAFLLSLAMFIFFKHYYKFERKV